MNPDWHQRTEPAAGGHLMWTGPLHHGSPTHRVRHRDRAAVRYLAYQEHHNRPADGRVTNTCKLTLCVAGAHLLDYTDRQRLYSQRAAALGQPTYEGICRNSHSLAEHAVFRTDGERRCGACAQDLPAEPDDLAVEQVVAGYQVPLLTWTDRREAVRLLIRRGATHNQCAEAVGVASRTVSRWAARQGWRKPQHPLGI